MKETRRAFVPRTIDRVMFHILAALHVANGAYLIGPWYLDENDMGDKAPLQSLFDSDVAVNIYGCVLIINGCVLFYSAVGRYTRRFYASITSGALLSGFLLRLYSLIGVLLVLESWRPPSYLSHAASVVMLGAYWVWVRVNVRTIQ